MTTRETYRKTIEARLDAWEDEIARLEQKAKTAEREAHPDYGDLVETLRETWGVARERVQDLDQAGETGWQRSKESIESAFSRLHKTLDEAGLEAREDKEKRE